MSKALGQEVASRGITVNCIAPGFIETPMTEQVRTDNERRHIALSRTGIGRFGQPDEIGHLIAFLLSDKASFITGSTHLADGGYTST